MAATTKQTTFSNIREFDRMFPDEAACENYLMLQRWPGGKVTCPYCKAEKVYVLKSVKKKWRCAGECKRNFSVRVGSMYEDSNLGLHTWFKVLFLLTNTSKGLSSVNIGKLVGITQKSAWMMLSKIRRLMQDNEPLNITTEAEADEVYWGGKDKWKHKHKRSGVGGFGTDKVPIIGIAERGGKIVAQSLPRFSAQTFDTVPFLQKHVAPGAVLHTDESKLYRKAGKHYTHRTVAHAASEYVRIMDGHTTHTQTIDGFWSLLRRGITGIYHQVSPHHLDLYIGEYTLRYNLRRASLQERFDTVLRRADGRVLPWKQLTAKPEA